MKTTATTILLVLAMVAGALAQDLGEMYDKGLELFENNRFKDAENIFTEIIRQDSGFTEALVFRALSKHSLQDYNSALQDFELAIYNNPFDTLVYLMKADLETDMELYEAAIVDYSNAIALSPEDAELYRSRGNLYYFLDHYLLSGQDFQEASKLSPGDASDYFYIGVSKNNLGLYRDALKYLSTAISLAPDDAVIYFQRGIAYEAVADIEEACDDWRKAKALGLEDIEDVLQQNCK